MKIILHYKSRHHRNMVRLKPPKRLLFPSATRTRRNMTNNIRKLDPVTGEEERSYKPVLESQLDILRHGTFSDVTFIVGARKERIPCHQLFLKIRSPVFEVMFSERWNQDNSNEIPLEDVNPETFKAFLNFIYSDSLSLKADVSQTLELLELAHKYDVQRLVEMCEERLKNRMMLKDAVTVFQAIRKYERKQLMDEVGDKLAESLSELQTLPSFSQLDKETLLYILKRDVVEMTEVDLFHLALQWAGNQTDATVEESLTEILPLIRFPTMTLDEFTTTVVPTNILPPARVNELFTYFGTDDKAKRRLLAKTIGFSAQQRLPKDLANYTIIYADYSKKSTRHQEFESLKECLQFHESPNCLWGMSPREPIRRIGLSAITFHCPVLSGTTSCSFKTFKICLKSKKPNHYNLYDFSSNQSYTELLNMSSVEVEEGNRIDVRFDAVIPLEKNTLYCITVEEITTAEVDVGMQVYEAEDFGPGPSKSVAVRVNDIFRTGLTVERNRLKGFWKLDSAQARPHLICRLRFQEL